jgi:hypothetical protein
MTTSEDRKAKPGDTVVLIELPPGFLEGLPSGDQAAISEMVGKSLLWVENDEAGRAELEFRDREGVVHYIYVSPTMIALSK